MYEAVSPITIVKQVGRDYNRSCVIAVTCFYCHRNGKSSLWRVGGGSGCGACAVICITVICVIAMLPQPVQMKLGLRQGGIQCS